MGEYNGWANRATWNVNLWLSNDEPIYRAAIATVKQFERGRRQFDAEAARMFCTMQMGEQTPDGDKLSDANWTEIAESMIEMAGN